MFYVLGIHCTEEGHDAGFCLVNSQGEIVSHCELERLSRIKSTNKFQSDRFNPIPYLQSLIENNPVHIFVTESGRSNLHPYLTPLNPKQITIVPHHTVHAYSVLPFYPELHNTSVSVVVADGRGYNNGSIDSSIIGTFETGELRISSHNTIPSSTELGWFLGPMSAGKLMGLAGYFPDVQPAKLPKELRLFHKHNSKDKYPEQYLKQIAAHYKYRIETIKTSIQQTLPPTTKLIVAGGTFLALELNSWIYNNITPNLYYSPATNDSGLALGAATFGLRSLTKQILTVTSPFLNTNINPAFPSTSLSPKQLAELLATNNIVGMIRGQSEIGPRALGHRSILASPTFSDMYQRISINLKQREHYRPLAPIVTDKQFDLLFDGPKGKYMQYTTHCKPITQSLLTSICHKDNTSRPQVITEYSDPYLYETLVELGKLTGFECAINTSLNHQKPIVHNYRDAIEDFEHCPNQILLATSNE